MLVNQWLGNTVYPYVRNSPSVLWKLGSSHGSEAELCALVHTDTEPKDTELVKKLISESGMAWSHGFLPSQNYLIMYMHVFVKAQRKDLKDIVPW